MLLVTVAGILIFTVMRHYRVFYPGDELIKERRLAKAHRLQTYIAENDLATKDIPDVEKWADKNRIHFYVIGTDREKSGLTARENRYVNNRTTADILEQIGQAQRIRFRDDDIWIYVIIDSAKTERYLAVTCVILISVVLYSLVLYLTFRDNTKYMVYLVNELSYMSQGILDREVVSRGDDELGLIGLHINELRKSIFDQIRKEREAIEANRDLVTAVSHDLRTPLTRQIGYLEILYHKKTDNESQRDEYIEKARKNAFVMRDTTDKLFNYFQAFSQRESGQRAETDGREYLKAAFLEQSAYLSDRGFDIEYDRINRQFAMLVDPENLPRVFDNVYQNLEKYADKGEKIKITHSFDDEEHTLTITVENGIRVGADRISSSGIGIKSSARIMEYHNGSIRTERKGEVYFTSLTFTILPAL